MNVMYYTDVDEHTSGLNFSKSRKPIQTVHRVRTEYHGPRDSNLSKPSLIVLRVPKPLRIWTDSMLALNYELSRKSSLESHVLRESHTSIIFRSTPNASCSNGTSIRATTGCNNITACFCCPWICSISVGDDFWRCVRRPSKIWIDPSHRLQIRLHNSDFFAETIATIVNLDVSL